MSKRKRERESAASSRTANDGAVTKVVKTDDHTDVKTSGPVIQIVAGSYERVLHGITASLSDVSSEPTVQFADSFLFNAHAAAIRCLAIAPLPEQDSAEDQGVYLATGGSDERVNVYSLSASPLPEGDRMPTMPTLGNNKVSENPRNRELGSLMQHSSNITALHFPTRTKLLSAAEDNTISISRVRDLTVVSTIKAPRPKVEGQPSGDTAPPGATPAGVNDFAIHPSMKLMISIGKGERCMRLWNLVTGKKAGVLSFDRKILAAVREGKYSSGEGRKIRWNFDGTEFAIAFERGVIVFGDDSKPKCIVLPHPLTKVHQIVYVKSRAFISLLAISTEDGRIVFFDTSDTSGEALDGRPSAKAVAQLGGRATGLSGRIKDFKVLQLDSSTGGEGALVIITANSDGAIRLWHLKDAELHKKATQKQVSQIGTMVGNYDTGNRITCLDAFVMLPIDELGALSEFEGLTEEESDGSSEDSE